MSITANETLFRFSRSTRKDQSIIGVSVFQMMLKHLIVAATRLLARVSGVSPVSGVSGCFISRLTYTTDV